LRLFRRASVRRWSLYFLAFALNKAHAFQFKRDTRRTWETLTSGNVANNAVDEPL
jgi:hypothetical protein